MKPERTDCRGGIAAMLLHLRGDRIEIGIAGLVFIAQPRIQRDMLRGLGGGFARRLFGRGTRGRRFRLELERGEFRRLVATRLRLGQFGRGRRSFFFGWARPGRFLVFAGNTVIGIGRYWLRLYLRRSRRGWRRLGRSLGDERDRDRRRFRRGRREDERPLHQERQDYNDVEQRRLDNRAAAQAPAIRRAVAAFAEA